MIAIIDSQNLYSKKKIFDLTITERLLRQLFVCGIRRAIVLSADSKDAYLKTGFEKHFDIDVTFEKAIHVEPDVDTLLLDGDGIYDDRVLSALLAASGSLSFVDKTNKNAPRAIKLKISKPTSLLEMTTGPIEEKDINTIDTYIRFLRKSYAPILLRVNQATNLRHLENDLYDKTFKSGLEWIAIYGYKIPVRGLTRFFAKTTITPNQITTFAIACRFAAIPVIASSWMPLGFALAVIFIVLDSLDGKLARLTFRLSDAADWIDHSTSMPARIAWYLAMAWHFSDGDLFAAIATWGLAGAALQVFDEINWLLIKRKFHKSLFDFSPLDSSVHLFTARKNDMFFMLLASGLGFEEGAYKVVSIWMAATVTWRTLRTLWIFILKKKPE